MSIGTKKYAQPRTTKFDFNGPHGAITTILGLPFCIDALALLCTENGCPPDLSSMDFNKLVQNPQWFDPEAMLVPDLIGSSLLVKFPLLDGCIRSWPHSFGI